MTPIQTFGANPVPSNMQFPTAAYLQASQNAAEMQARGMSALGQGLAGGINSAVAQYSQHKDEQAKFDATKKMYSAFKNYLPEQSRNEIDKMFSDTSMSIREKNQISPLLMNMIAQGQQQAGRESVAKIMADSRQAVADSKPRPNPMPEYGVRNPRDVFNRPVNGQPVSEPALPGSPSQGSAEQLVPRAVPFSQMPPTRKNPQTGVPQFWDPVNKRYVDDLWFDPTNLEISD